MSHVDDRVTHLSNALGRAAIEYECYHDCIVVCIPGGQLEVKFWEDGTESVQMVRGDFHTHLEFLALEYEMEEDEAFTSFVKNILDGRLLVVEETSSAGKVRITIENSLEAYLKYLPSDAAYRVLNAT
jgi:hypothetical protein